MLLYWFADFFSNGDFHYLSFIFSRMHYIKSVAVMGGESGRTAPCFACQGAKKRVSAANRCLARPKPTSMYITDIYNSRWGLTGLTAQAHFCRHNHFARELLRGMDYCIVFYKICICIVFGLSHLMSVFSFGLPFSDLQFP